VLQAFAITFRDGLEAFLIVAVTLVFLRRHGRGATIAAVRLGIPAALVAAALGGTMMSRVVNQALLRGILACAAAAATLWLAGCMWRAARLDRTIDGTTARVLLFLGTVLMIARDGMETALLLAALVFQVRAADLIASALAGSLTAAAIAWAWVRAGPRLNRAAALWSIAIFLALFIGLMSITGFHELTEAEVFPESGALHNLTEEFGPYGAYSGYLTYLLLAAPLLGWAAGLFLGHGKATDGRVAQVGTRADV
jgi:high-affinity iron transporter